jgi:hypothetical protein
MATTTNFSWATPDDSANVKDGASAIRSLGTAIDTSLVDLKGGTTGQVLSKNSNTDLDYAWVAQDDSNAIQNALLTTTGDTIYASGASTPARLGIGTTGQILTVAGGVPTWAAAPSASLDLAQIATGTLSGTSVNISGLTQDFIQVIFYAPTASSTQNISIRLNSDSATTAYYYNSSGIRGGGAPNFDYSRYHPGSTADRILMNTGYNQHLSSGGQYIITFQNCKAAGFTTFSGQAAYTDSTSAPNTSWWYGYYNSESQITSIQINNIVSFTGGTYRVIGA